VHREIRVTLVLLALRVYKVLLVLLEKLVKVDPPEHRVRPEFRASKEPLVLQVHKDLRVSPVVG
jgi:hypothetical protein